MAPVAEHRDVERARWDFFQSIPLLDREPDRPRHGQGQPGPGAALRVLGRLWRVRRDALPAAGQPALRRPDDRRQRDGLLIDLRRQPAHDTVDGERGRTRTRLGQLPVRGQRRVRTRDAARPRRPDRPGPPAPRASPARSSAPELVDGLLGAAQDTEAEIVAQRERVGALHEALAAIDGPLASRRPPPGDARRRPRPQGRVDHRRRRLGLRHRLRWRRPGPLVGSQRQHPGPGHGGLLEHRRPGLEGDPARCRRQVRGRREGHGQEGPRARSRGRTATSTSPRSRWARTTSRPPRPCSRPTPGRGRRSSSPTAPASPMGSTWASP